MLKNLLNFGRNNSSFFSSDFEIGQTIDNITQNAKSILNDREDDDNENNGYSKAQGDMKMIKMTECLI